MKKTKIQKLKFYYNVMNVCIVGIVICSIVIVCTLLYSSCQYKISNVADLLFTAFDSPTTEVQANTVEETKNTIYIEELDRNVEKVTFNIYYDSVNKCYFKYNLDSSPTQWYYYYTDISSQYSTSYKDTYGWMVYNKYNDRWSIYVGDKEWKILEDVDLWHFDNPHENTVVN
jgi:hypothetical protein